MTCQFANEDCAGRLEWHHVVKQQRLKREFRYGAWRHPGEATYRPIGRHGVRSIHETEHLSLTQILGDPRNRVWVCSFHHERISNGRVKVELPDSVWEFARAFGLEGMLENDLRRAA